MLNLQRRLTLPHVPGRLVLLVVAVWACALVVVDWGVVLRAHHAFVLVARAEHCQISRAPATHEVVAQVAPGDVLRVRDFAKVQGELCYRVATEGGVYGWVPYHPSFLGSDGYFIAWRDFSADN